MTFVHSFVVAENTDEMKLFKASALWPTGGLELRRIDQRDLEMALAQDQVSQKDIKAVR